MGKPRNPVVRDLIDAPKRNAGRHAPKRKESRELVTNEPDGICDRCATPTILDELITPADGDWSGCSLCPGCAVEI